MTDRLDAVAIDGPAGAGKSTIARGVADRLGFVYVDTGAMYRAVALRAIRSGAALEDEEAMGRVAQACSIRFADGGRRVFLDGEDVSEAIRSPEVTRNTRFAARAKPVREVLVEAQRQMAAEAPVVMEGRDITTVVLDRARWKFFLSAAPEERARRRQLEMEAAGHVVDPAELLAEIRARDESDHQVGPLARAWAISRDPEGDIKHLDTTHMTPQQVIEHIVDSVRAGERS